MAKQNSFPTVLHSSGFAIIALVIFGCILLLIGRSDRPDSPSKLKLTIEVMTPSPLIVPGESIPNEKLSQNARDIARLHVNSMNSKSREDYMKFFSVRDRSRRSQDAIERQHWERVVELHPDKRHEAIFSCVTIGWADRSIAFTHVMGGAYKGTTENAPGFPFMVPRGHMRNRDGQWEFDDGLNATALGRYLAATKPQNLKANEP